MSAERPITLLAALKGAPLSTFLAIARHPGLGPSALRTLTGWGRGATYDALRRLASAGWIERPYRGRWVLTDTGRLALWTLTGASDTPATRRRPRLAVAPAELSIPDVPPSDISPASPEISPTGTNSGPAALEISPAGATTHFDVSPDDPSRAPHTPLEIPAGDTSTHSRPGLDQVLPAASRKPKASG